MGKFFYVYTLESLAFAGRFYVGFAEDIAERLGKHNEGGVPHTAKF